MSYLETKYISLVSSQLLKFTKKKEGLYNFRCPYCGDSKKRQDKARGYFIKVKNEYIYKCHNCGIGKSFTNFLKDNCLQLHDEYVMERFKEGLTGKGYQTPTPTFNFSTPVFKPKTINNLQKISELEEDHPARIYLEERKITNLDIFYYCPKFKEWANSRKRGAFDNLRGDSPRIIIPIIDTAGEFAGFQGRSLNPTAKLRYITIMFSSAALKVYGCDKVDYQKTVYVTEGPFDSLFLDNAIAMLGADVDTQKLAGTFRGSTFVFVLDNEPRNKEIVSRYQKIIKEGHPIVIWPSSIEQKDINDMVLVGLNPQEIVNNNTYQGLQAQVKFNEWKKV